MLVFVSASGYRSTYLVLTPLTSFGPGNLFDMVKGETCRGWNAHHSFPGFDADSSPVFISRSPSGDEKNI